MKQRASLNYPGAVLSIRYAPLKGIPLLDIPEFRNEIITSLNYCIEEKGLVVYGFLIVPAGVWLICKRRGIKTLSGIIRDHKRHTSRLFEANIHRMGGSFGHWLAEFSAWRGRMQAGNENFQFWEQQNLVFELESREEFWNELDSLHTYPVEHGYVEQPEHWLLSSARAYIRQPCQVNVKVESR